MTGPSLVSPAPEQRGRRARPSQPAQGRVWAAQADAGAPRFLPPDRSGGLARSTSTACRPVGRRSDACSRRPRRSPHKKVRRSGRALGLTQYESTPAGRRPNAHACFGSWQGSAIRISQDWRKPIAGWRTCRHGSSSRGFRPSAIASLMPDRWKEPKVPRPLRQLPGNPLLHPCTVRSPASAGL